MKPASRRAFVVVLGAVCGLALLAAAAPTAVAQDETPEVEVTVDYELTADGEAVLVETTVENLDRIEEPVRYSLPASRYVEDLSVDGFRDGQFYWETEDSVDSATINYRYDLADDNLAEANQSGDRPWAVVNLHERVKDYSSYDPQYTHQTDGHLVDHRDEIFLYDDAESATVRADTATVTVVGNPDEMRESPEETARAIADVSNTVEAGAVDNHVTAYAVPDAGDDKSGFARGSSLHFTDSDRSIYDTGSTWFHEYAHNVDATRVSSDMRWFREGYADYGAVLYGMRAGYQDFDEYRSQLESWSGERVVLSNQSEWGDDQEYNQGSRVLAKLDYEIRTTTDGEATIDDLLARMHGSNSLIDLDDFHTHITKVATEDVADETVRLLTNTDPVFENGIWDRTEHEAVFGPAPDVSTSVEATLDDRRGERGFDTDSTSVITAGDSVDIAVSATNDGGAEAYYNATIQIVDLDTETRVATIGDTQRVAGDDTAQTTITYAFEDHGKYEVRTAAGDFTVFALDADTRYLSSDDEYGSDPRDPLLLDSDDSLMLNVGVNTDVTLQTTDGKVLEEVTDTETPIVEFGSETFDQSSDYELVISYNGEKRRYVRTLEPVDGTVPDDLNGDGLHRDFDGDGEVTTADVDVFQANQFKDEIQNHPDAYDFSGDGSVSHSDVMALFQDASGV